MALEYKGYKQKSQHIELIWQEHLRTDFESRQCAIILNKQTRDLAAVRLIDAELGTAFMALPSKRLFVQRWESDTEATGSSRLNKHYTATLAKTISKPLEKQAMFLALTKTIRESLNAYPEIGKILGYFADKKPLPKTAKIDAESFLRKKFAETSISQASSAKAPAQKFEQVNNRQQPIVTKSSNYFLLFLGLIAASVALLVMVGKGCI